MKKKEQEKLQYDIKVKTQYFSWNNFAFLKHSIPHLGKLTKQWRKLFIINNFDKDHGASYVPKIFDGKPALNTHYGDYLRIFQP